MSEKVKAIVIKASDRKEKDKNILLFSLERGKIWATLKGVKSPKAKMKVAQNPFVFGEFLLEDGKAGNVVTGVDVLESFHEISEDIDKYFEGSAVLQVVSLMEISENNAPLFTLTLKTLKSICFSVAHAIYALDKFLLEVFKLSGTPIYTEKCSCCGSVANQKYFIDYKDGGLVCASCKGFGCEELSKTTYMALKILSNTDFDKLQTIKLVEGSELALLKILSRNFEAQFDKKLKFIGIFE
ncbi:MAG: DNA repair protein RecO [Candidatus Caccovivens sp.]